MIYIYGMRLRGFAPGTFPKEGFSHREDDTSGRYWDVLAYNRKLTEKEIRDYELDFIGEDFIREEKQEDV